MTHPGERMSDEQIDLVARAEKYKADNERAERAEQISDTIERQHIEARRKLAAKSAECERLREALETIGNGDVDYKNGQYEAQSLANELYAIRAFADAALHPTTKGDEDE